MNIDRIELRLCRLEYRHSWETSFGIEAASHTLIVKVESDGAAGWGESSPGRQPTYCPESAEICYAALSHHLIPAVMGKSISHPGEITNLLSIFRGNPFAKAAIETAIWDIFARREGKPLHQLLGGRMRRIQAGADFGIEANIDDLLEKISAVMQQGCPRVKLKIAHGKDIDVIRTVRETFPDLTFHVDCNGCYRLAEDLELLKLMDECNLAMIEQPLHHTDLVRHAELQKQLATPICLDESISSPRDFELAMQLGSCQVVNVKPGRVGGLSNAMAIEKMARDAGIPAWVGGMLESGLGVGILIELASLPGFTYPGDIFPSERFYEQDITERPVMMDDTFGFSLSQVPGTGYFPNMDCLEKAVLKFDRWNI